jgi:hypothetical protein
MGDHDRDERVSRLSRARRADSDDRRRRVLAVIDGFAADSQPLPIAELARRANVHRSFLYRHPDLYELAVATPLRKQITKLEDERDRLQQLVHRGLVLARMSARAAADALIPFVYHADDCATEVNCPCDCGLDLIFGQLDASEEVANG